jgi:hypothetical protein
LCAKYPIKESITRLNTGQFSQKTWAKTGQFGAKSKENNRSIFEVLLA